MGDKRGSNHGITEIKACKSWLRQWACRMVTKINKKSIVGGGSQITEIILHQNKIQRLKSKSHGCTSQCNKKSQKLEKDHRNYIPNHGSREKYRISPIEDINPVYLLYVPQLPQASTVSPRCYNTSTAGVPWCAALPRQKLTLSK